MAGKLTKTQRTYTIDDSDGVALYTGVTYGATEGSVKKPTADNAVPVGVVDNDERLNVAFQASGDQKGRNVAVAVDGYAEVKLSGTVAYGDRVILATGGDVKKMPADAGQYNVVGFAEKAGVDGDVIPVKLAYHVYTVA